MIDATVMNASLLKLEFAVLLLGLGVLLLDLWLPAERRRALGWAAAGGLIVLLLGSFLIDATPARLAFGESYVLDELSLFFKRLFLLAGAVVLVMEVEFADRIKAGLSEFFSLTLFALAGMLFAASANDFAMLFVSIELITVTFYVLVSFQHARVGSLEAGIKYLILGAVSSAFLIYGIALVYGITGTMDFNELKILSLDFAGRPLFLLGLLMVLVGLGFKIAAFPMQIWAPDVYEGAPSPVTAFLAVGSKAAGFVLLMRLFLGATIEVTRGWESLLMVLAALTILYGNLCAIPQRNLKRLMGYSSVANAGYLLLGVSALSLAGSSAILYYLAGYLFTVLAAFMVICLVLRQSGAEDIASLAGLHQRAPLLAAAMTFSMISLAGIPPLAGFFGKFLLLKAVVEQAARTPCYYWLLGVALAGVVISIYYYFGVIQAIYWSKEPSDLSPIAISRPARISLYVCMAGIVVLGIFPGAFLNLANEAVKVLRL